MAYEDELFGPVASLIGDLRAVKPLLRGSEYSFMPSADYQILLETDLAGAMKVYWTEILYRAHYSSLISLLRTIGWVEATLAAARESTFYGFAASYRGLLEAAADSHDALSTTLVNLAHSHILVRQALDGVLEGMALHPTLENELIHFTHARRLPKEEDAPDSHRARPTTHYLKVLEGSCELPVLECYRKLCEITHPAAASAFLYSESDGHGRWRIGDTSDRELIEAFCRIHGGLGGPVLVLGVAPALYQLRVVQEFGLPELSSPDLELLSVDGPVWTEIEIRLRNDSPPSIQDLSGSST